MNALTLWRPWPWAIFHAPRDPKRIENRPRKPWAKLINTQIVLHAGKVFDSDAANVLCSRYHMHPDGTPPFGWADEGLIGVVTVRGHVTSRDDCERFMVGAGDWFIGPFGWLLSGVHAFAAPIPCRGMQGVWPVPAAVAALVVKANPNLVIQ